MATNNSSTPRRSQSRDHVRSNTTDILQSNDRVDGPSHRGAKGAGEYPYLSSSKRADGSTVELRAGANSAANSDQPPLGPPNTVSRLFGPQTTASESSRPAPDEDVRQVAQYPTDSVRTPRYHFNSWVCDSDIWPQPRRGASGSHNPTTPGLSSSKSSPLFDAPRITEGPSTTTILQSDDRATGRETHREAKRTVQDGESPYSSPSKSRNGSAAELHELRAGANSSANSSQPPTAWGRSNPTSRTFAPQATASKSSRPPADDDAERVVQYPTDSVSAPCQSNCLRL
jgi:hypothetical protein